MTASPMPLGAIGSSNIEGADPLPSSPPIASRQSYEAGGWHDGRLGQAYDLLDAVLRDHPDDLGEVRCELQKAIDSTEQADQLLEDAAAQEARMAE